MATDPAAVTKLYERIPLDAMQQVSESYMAWYVDRVTRSLDEIMAGLRAELRENDAKEASFRPSPSEVEAIERLQRSGVTGVDLLDRMVEQGEDWLTVTMRRLDHFERTGLAPKDYSTWGTGAGRRRARGSRYKRAGLAGQPWRSAPRGWADRSGAECRRQLGQRLLPERAAPGRRPAGVRGCRRQGPEHLPHLHELGATRGTAGESAGRGAGEAIAPLASVALAVARLMSV
jgi:hypothetical protein